MVIFHDDGTYFQSAAPDGSTGDGQDETGVFAGTTKVRGTIDVDATGEALTAEYTLDFIDPAGASSGEMGPATATAERITVEPMGTPTTPMPMEATPAA